MMWMQLVCIEEQKQRTKTQERLNERKKERIKKQKNQEKGKKSTEALTIWEENKAKDQDEVVHVALRGRSVCVWISLSSGSYVYWEGLSPKPLLFPKKQKQNNF